MWRLGLAAMAALAVVACSDGPECRTRQDCFDLGKGRLDCVAGACVEACAADADCRADNPRSQAVCERGICQAGCPETACAAGETCNDGRCSVFFESFEGTMSGAFVTLETLGWNASGRELGNQATQVVWTGPPTCTAADRPERCAGPAAEGEYYLAVERAPTPATTSFEFGPTCGACTCCRACRDPSAREADMVSCFGTTLPGAGAMCGGTPPECTAICQQCEACPVAPAGTVGDGLDMCALQAAGRTCPGCPPYDACVQAKLNEGRACPGGNYPACDTPPQGTQACQECLRKECDSLRPACWACRDVPQLKRDYPNDPAQWRDLELACEAQGADGCYNTPINVPRNVLTDEEQAAESPAISLAGLSGNVVLELRYVPFNIGATYRRVIQGQDRLTWPLERQEVRVQLCGGGCAAPSAWKDVPLASGADAALPREDERGNGLQFAEQSAADWNADVLVVPVPAELRTADFHFRLLPRLQDGSRVGVDRVLIRRLP